VIVLDETRDRRIYRAIRAQARQVRRHAHHVHETQKWRGRELLVALLEDAP
jgi:hypothetical protein